MKHIIIATGMAFVALAGCSGGGGTPAPTVTVTAAAPAPVESTPAEDEDVAILREVWDGYSPKEQSTMCNGYAIAPESMWRSFSKNTDMVTQEQFEAFLDEQCV